jgi:histidyl-tRNA synthetase
MSEMPGDEIDLPLEESSEDEPGTAPGPGSRIRPRVFKGTRDFLPAEMIRREDVFAYLRQVFRRHGFSPLETPAFEYLEVLLGKYGSESEKLIYPLAYRDGRTLALRYDLTVPLARVVAQYPELARPFKRYQMQPVWRAERHQLHRGRYREFYQCDADIVGESHRLADAEILAVAGEVLAGLEVGPFKVRVNHRRILRGIVRAAGLPDEAGPAVLRAIDKIDKVGATGVEIALAQEGIEENARTRILSILDRPPGGGEVIRSLGNDFAGEQEIAEGCADLLVVWNYLAALGATVGCFEFRLDLARGLDYYTGAVFESFLESLPHIGSLTGGGRYDGLVGVFSEDEVPAVGTTIGIDRILAALEQSGRSSGRSTVTQILVLQFGAESEAAALRMTGRLRQAGIATEVWYRPDRLKKQLAQADRRGIPVVLLQGPDELARGEWTAKRLASGEQRCVAEIDLPAAIGDWLA